MGRHWGEVDGEDHPHKEITQAIIGEAIEIQKALGHGLLEDPYKVCLAHSLRLAGHKVKREVFLDIEWRGLVVERAYRLDLLVDDLVVVEAKAEWRSACSSISVSGLSKTVESSG
ncbi:GxxExxY protein [Mesoterricola sediminis]|uniref:GxxExxY protein n=1 Tax=Mesoterricola sediminis TaxID=2927980 RepID=A0AA48GVY1_9BACT|nr:GxxExxY protein [Mesoterricola sediminis]BDU75348.1 hypothetical protein METESE_03060 [Mesoterricola sediminis]BDU78804.1 hypothetical protein METESE_37620 [Mesoterricola sediminis]